MKTRISALALLFCLQPCFAADPVLSVPDQDDKSTCQINNTVIELKTTSVSPSNPEYRKEAELLPGLKAKFAKLYIIYGTSTYVFRLIATDEKGEKVVAMAQNIIPDENRNLSRSAYPTLVLKSDVVIGNQTHRVVCNFVIDGNKEQG